MNKQIKQLVEQAKAYANDSTKDYTGNEPIGFMDYYTEKFAELIVSECVKVVSNGKYSVDECRGNTHRIAHNNARSEALLDIKNILELSNEQT